MYKNLFFKIWFCTFVVLAFSRCEYHDTTIINIENHYYDATNLAEIPIVQQVHPVEFLWHIDEDLIYNNHNQVIQPLEHSFLVPSREGFYYRFEIAENERDKFRFGENFQLLDNCDESWYSVKRIDDFHFELYLNTYCHNTQLDLHQILFIIEIQFL